MFRRTILVGMTVASALAIGAAQAKTIRIAEHRPARIDALNKVVPDIEKKYNVHIEVVEYPPQRRIT
jgi:multiple sugar transport system substrate-binding protein